MPFRVLTTPAFEREVRKLTSRNVAVVSVISKLIGVLEEDPHNRSGRFAIKKLAGVKSGDGQWRVRSGNYRLRYDIFDEDVVLHSFRDRKEAY